MAVDSPLAWPLSTRLAAALAAVLAAWAPAASAGLDGFVALAQPMAEAAAARSAPGLRVQVQVGALDARLRLAPCKAVEAYLPPNTRLWGASRIGLRCTDAGVRWNVFLPVQVNVFGPAWVATGALPAGTVLQASHLQRAEAHLSAARQPVLVNLGQAVGRALQRPLSAGEALRGSDLRPRQWFAAGDAVRLVAVGSGWRIDGQGQAMAPGLEGAPVRVRTESGRVVSGMPVGERQVEVAL